MSDKSDPRMPSAVRHYVAPLINPNDLPPEYSSLIAVIFGILGVMMRARLAKAIVLLSPFEANELLPAFRRGGGAQLHMIAPRIHQVQNLMLCERPLTLPIRGRSHEARFHDSHIAQLLAFSGSAYFANACEQDAYCEFLCLRPRPRSAIDDVAFQSGDIQLDGFFRPDKRKQVSEIEASARVFQRSPVQFMSKLLCARGRTGHAAASHVGQILCIGERAQIGTN